MSGLLYGLARRVPCLAIDVPVVPGHGEYLTILPFVVLVEDGHDLTACMRAHEGAHTIFALSFILPLAALGHVSPISNGWVGAAVGLAVYWLTNAFEPWWWEQTAERVEDRCRGDR